jgi:hypothetical protein
MLETSLQDARFATRLLIKSPLFAITAALSLAIGIGANTTISQRATFQRDERRESILLWRSGANSQIHSPQQLRPDRWRRQQRRHRRRPVGRYQAERGV